MSWLNLQIASYATSPRWTAARTTFTSYQKQTDHIVDNLTVINQDGNDLDDLLEETSRIVSNLGTINDSDA